jgi:hypothetical protein
MRVGLKKSQNRYRNSMILSRSVLGIMGMAQTTFPDFRTVFQQISKIGTTKPSMFVDFLEGVISGSFGRSYLMVFGYL